MKTLIMGRGKSLERINELNDINIEECFLVGRFSEELKDKNISKFIQDKEIVHAVSPHNTQRNLTKQEYEKINIKYCLFNRREKVYDIIQARGVNEIRRFGIKTKWYTDNMMEIAVSKLPAHKAPGFPTSGMGTIAYVSWELKRKQVYCIGIDFYDSPYFTTKVDPHLEIIHNIGEGNRLRRWLKELVYKTPDTKYYFITYSNPKLIAPNVFYL